MLSAPKFVSGNATSVHFFWFVAVQARFLLAKLNPSSTYNSEPGGGMGGSEIIMTDDVSLQVICFANTAISIQTTRVACDFSLLMLSLMMPCLPRLLTGLFFLRPGVPGSFEEASRSILSASLAAVHSDNILRTVKTKQYARFMHIRLDDRGGEVVLMLACDTQQMPDVPQICRLQSTTEHSCCTNSCKCLRHLSWF